MIFKRSRPARILTRTFTVGALGVLLTAGTGTAAFAAHRNLAVQRPLRGLITTVGTNNLQLQTASGSVTVSFARGTTQVVRFVMGSTADVTAGKRVDLRVVKGSRTVYAIHVEQNKPVQNRPVAGRFPSRSGTPHRDVSDVSPQPLTGQVVSLSGGTLTLRFANGSTGTFALASNVNVNEALIGSLADLGVGETVQIFLAKSGTVARSIIITNA